MAQLGFSQVLGNTEAEECCGLSLASSPAPTQLCAHLLLSLWLNEFCPQRNKGIKTSNSSGPALFVTSLFSNAQNPQGRWCWQEAASSETARLDLFLLSLMQHIALYGAFEFIYNTVLKNKRPLGNRCNCKGNC